uniref:CUB domain-containing protein n=1 Tax=Globodera pallida TaxID=36090 RepID=A0A183C1W8_GLOPA
MVEQVEWSSQKSSVLIIACQSGIVSYDSNIGTFIWAIRQPGMTISSNHLTTFAYDKHFVYALNASNGTLASDPLHFAKPQKKIVAVGDKGNVWYVGITEEAIQSIAMLFLAVARLLLPMTFLSSPHSLSAPPNPLGRSCVHPLNIEQTHSPHETKHGKYSFNGTKARFSVELPSKGFVASDGYPNGYENQKCSVELSATPFSGLVVHLSFDQLDLEARYSRSGQCLRDYLVVTIIDQDGREHTSERICGNERPKPIRTMQSRARILFIASSSSSNFDQTRKRKGFRIKFEFVPECIPLTLNDVAFYYDTDRRFVSDCGGPNEMSGEIRSPGFPSTYPRNVTCNWLLRVAPDHRINIRLLEIEFSTAFECERASLQFFDAKTTNETADVVDGRRSLLFTSREGPSQKQLEDFEAKRKPNGFHLIWTEVESLVHTSADDLRTLRTSPSGVTRQSFVAAEQCAGFVCRGGEFCVDAAENICVERTRLCINQTLRCDGMANCAENDDSDESFCYVQKMMSLATIVSLFFLLSLILLLCCLAYGILKCLRTKTAQNTKKYRRKRTTSSDGILEGNGKAFGEQQKSGKVYGGTAAAKTMKRRDINLDKAGEKPLNERNPTFVGFKNSPANGVFDNDVWAKRVSTDGTNFNTEEKGENNERIC